MRNRSGPRANWCNILVGKCVSAIHREKKPSRMILATYGHDAHRFCSLRFTLIGVTFGDPALVASSHSISNSRPHEHVICVFTVQMTLPQSHRIS